MSAIEKSKDILPERMYHAYAELFPNEFEFLVLYHLYINYPSAELQYIEVKQAIVDTSRLPFLSTGKDRQIERTFKGLLRTFIERIPSKSNRFILTPHAEKIIEIAIQRINNPYLKFPLKETFETYFTIPINSTDEIRVLQSWYKFGFQNNARQVVIGHLEGLKISVDDAIKELNLILEADDLSAIQLLERFSSNFQLLGEKARQIAEAIQMKIGVHYQLRDIVDMYSNKAMKRERTNGDEEDYHTLRNDWEIAISIKKEVSIFFEKIDKQLDLVNMKLAFAGSKISELQETLRAQSHYKINLKKLLRYLLENSKADTKQGIMLPDIFPVRGLVQEKFRFRSLRYYDMGFLKRAIPIDPTTDESYEADQRHQIEAELTKQALIQKHCEQTEFDLKANSFIDLSSRLFDIVRQEESVEIGLQTGYEFLRNLSSEYTIYIEEELQSNINNTLHLWKSTIQNNQDSNS